MDRLTSACVVCLMFGTFTAAAEPEKPGERAKALIDQLVEVEELDTWYDEEESGSEFLPLRRNAREGDPVRSLVKLGANAVPALLDHLSDDRKTRIIATFEGFPGPAARQDEGIDAIEAAENGERGVRYTVRVGDLCYVALGQIVNREYTAVEYSKFGLGSATCVPRSRKLRAELVKEWGKLTAESHLGSLAKDLASSRLRNAFSPLCNGAAVRLGYFYPKEFEELVVKQLTRHTYDYRRVDKFIDDKLYRAKSEEERNELVDEFARRHGEIARDALCWELFFDLPEWEDDSLFRSHANEAKARECLAQLFGFTDQVTRKDRPAWEPPTQSTQADLVSTLVYDRSEKIDRIVRDWLAETDDARLGMKLMDRLVGRGYDTVIAAFIKRSIPKANEGDEKYLKEYEAKIGWTYLHRAVELDVPDLIEAAFKDIIDVNAQGKDGRTALHLAAESGNAEVVKQLLAAKADRGVKDEKGRTPLDLARGEEHAAVVKLLQGK